MLFIYNKYNKYIFLNLTSEDGYRALRGALWYGRFWLRGHHFQAESDGPGAWSNDKQWKSTTNATSLNVLKPRNG